MPDPTASEAARALGSIRTARKAAASAANLAPVNAARVPKPCTCNQDPHRYDCPVRHREYTQAYRTRKQKGD